MIKKVRRWTSEAGNPRRVAALDAAGVAAIQERLQRSMTALMDLSVKLEELLHYDVPGDTTELEALMEKQGKSLERVSRGLAATLGEMQPLEARLEDREADLRSGKRPRQR